MRIVICTGNPGKLKEIRALLPPRYELLTLQDIGLTMDLPETGATLEENALQKARFAFARSGGLACVADDTGLEVEALQGAPGVFSARYAGPERDPKANMQKLLEELKGGSDRRARFRTVIALITSEGERLFEGDVQGTIAPAPRGLGGFGYDPIFVPEGHTSSFAEMDAGAKDRISHRGRAMRALVRELTSGGTP